MKLTWLMVICLLFIGIASLQAAEKSELVRLPQVQRQRVTESTLVFPRIRLIYDLHQNPYQNFNERDWIDRPLLHDRSLQSLKPAERDLQNYHRQFQIAMNYGVNGLSELYHGQNFQTRFLSMLDAAESLYASNRNEILLDIIGNVLKEGPEKAASIFEPVLKRYLDSPTAARVGDKVIVSSYGADYVAPKDLARFISILKERCGDRFVFIAAISTPKGKRLTNWPTFLYSFAKHDGRIPADEVEAVKSYLRSYLDVADGLMINGSNHLDTLDDQFNAEFYEQFAIPLFAGVLNEPPYKGKLLGLSASLGYINHIAGGTQLENGTRALRQTLQIALNAKADLIIMPEWNELNENTNLEPTVNRSFSTQRIMRFFMAQANPKQHPLAPMAGDDLQIPNLIVSARASLALGQKYEVELLNVPDGSGGNQTFTAQCDIRDNTGRIICKSDSFRFNPQALTEHRIEIASETLDSSRLLYPVLNIRTADGRELSYSAGLPVTRLEPTWNRNLITLKQPLRDLASADALSVQATPKNAGFDFHVTAQSPNDPIRHVEILEDDTTVYSHDAASAYQLQQGDMLLHLSYSSKKEINPFPMKISVTGGQILYFQDRLRLGDPRETRNFKNDSIVQFDWKTNVNRRGGIFVVSNKDQSILDIATPVGDLHVPLARVQSAGELSFNLPETVAIRIEAGNRAFDIPKPINQNHVEFRHQTRQLNPGSVYRVRLITMAGKTAISGPYVLPPSAESDRVAINVLSESTGKTETISVDRSRLPHIRYELNQSDATLRTSAGERWFGAKAQGWSYGGPFSSSKMPEGASQLEPQNRIEDGAPALLFDGKDDYLSFPPEVIPARGSFSIEFEIKPVSLGKQFLIRGQNEYQGTLDLTLNNGKVFCTYRGEMHKEDNPYFDEISFSSPRQLKTGEWTRVKLTYNLKQISLYVADDRPIIFPYDRPAWWRLSPFTFGGWGPDSSAYFNGYLRSLAITHGAKD